MTESSSAIRQVAVIGAGLMGHGIAQVFACHGLPVRLTDNRPEALPQAMENIKANLEIMAGEGLMKQDDIKPALARIKTVAGLEEAAAGADLVVEAVTENLALKQDLFRRLDAICRPEAILATNTSVISITEIAAKASNQARIVGTHFWNPPHLVPLVEVIPGRETDPEVVERAMSLLSAAGKHPVRVKKDVPGFVGNRLQQALWREAVSIVERGIAEPAVVDEVIRFGFGIRLPVLGPLTNADLVGLDLTLAIHDYILPHLESSPKPSPLLKAKVESGELGFKTGRGLQDWSPPEMDRVRRRLTRHLLKWTKEQGHGEG